MENIVLLNGMSAKDTFVDGGWKLTCEDKESFTFECGDVVVTIYEDSISIHQDTFTSEFEWDLVLTEIKSLTVNTKQITVVLYCGNIFMFRTIEGGDL